MSGKQLKHLDITNYSNVCHHVLERSWPLTEHPWGWLEICLLPDLSTHKSKMERNLAVHTVWSQLYTVAVTKFICIAWCQSLFTISASSYFADSLQMYTLLCNTRVPHCHWVDSRSVKFACGKPRNQKSFYTKQVQYCLIILLLYSQENTHLLHEWRLNSTTIIRILNFTVTMIGTERSARSSVAISSINPTAIKP